MLLYSVTAPCDYIYVVLQPCSSSDLFAGVRDALALYNSGNDKQAKALLKSRGMLFPPVQVITNLLVCLSDGRQCAAQLS